MTRPLPFLGHSLLASLVRGRAEPRWIFSQFYLAEDGLVGRDPLRMVGLRDQTYSMVFDRRSGLIEAWDYRSDPFETHDLWRSSDSSTRRRLDEMKRVLDEFVAATHSPPRDARVAR